ncbi:hypothetical protein MTO96_001074 [Rhipicephalus appendiculatus]
MGTDRERAWVGVQAQLSKTVGPGTPRGQNGDAEDQAAEHVSSTHGPPPPLAGVRAEADRTRRSNLPSGSSRSKPAPLRLA